MDTETTTNPSLEPEPTTRRCGLLGGAVLGAAALTASVLGIGAIAGAQDEPEIDDVAAGDVMDADDEAWAAYDQCLSDALGSVDEDSLDEDSIDESTLSDEEWEALEQQFEDAERTCDDLLPEDAEAEIDGDDDGDFADDEADEEAFAAFDQCLTDAGLSDGSVVYVEDDAAAQALQFGEGIGTVTITGDASGVSVTTDGDVSVLDERAVEACEDLLPEEAFEDADDEIDDDEVDDEIDEDEDSEDDEDDED